jgi:competence protein ComEA
MAASSPAANSPSPEQRSGEPPAPQEVAATAPTASPPSAPPPPPEPAPAAWPRSAQFTLAGLIGAAAILIGWRWYADHRGARPAELQRSGAGAYQVDVNRAGRTELLQLPGVGPALADRILSHREANGPFRRIEDLRGVHGIGEATLKRLQPWVHVEVDTSEQEPDEPIDEPIRLSRKKPGGLAGNAPPPSAPAAMTGGAKPLPAEPVDVNRASAEELQRLPGVGPVMAARIVAERQKKPFAAVEDLRRVSGIGPKTLEKLRPYVRTGAD